MRVRALGICLSIMALAACGEQSAVAPVNELDLAASLSLDAQAAMGGETNAPASLLRRLVQAVRESDSREARALLARADELNQQARETGDRELAAQARGLVLQAVVLVFPNAPERIATVTRTGLERVRAALGNRDAPRIRRVLDEIGALLRRSAAATSEGRPAVALDYALRAADMLERLVDYVRDGVTSGTTR